MKNQNYILKNDRIKRKFMEFKKKNPDKFKKRLNLSWSNWMFGVEDLNISAKRLKEAGVDYIELHGNHYGENLGYDVNDTLSTLKYYDLKVSGICGMFSKQNDLSSNNPIYRQAALEYLKREIIFAKKVDAKYILVVPGAVGRPVAYDDMEIERSVESLRLIAHLFEKNNIQAAIEPIRSEETSIIHTISHAQGYIKAVNHPYISKINGDVFHMQSEESHIGEAIFKAGKQLINIHLADSNRMGLGEGSMDLDTIIMALYLLEFNHSDKYVTFEPLGPGGNPYLAKNSKLNKDYLDSLVSNTINYFRTREDIVLNH